MFKRMDKKLFAILRSFFLSKPVHVEWPLAFIIKPFHSGHQHTGKCIRRFGGIYAYCRYFVAGSGRYWC